MKIESQNDELKPRKHKKDKKSGGKKWGQGCQI